MYHTAALRFSFGVSFILHQDIKYILFFSSTESTIIAYPLDLGQEIAFPGVLWISDLNSLLAAKWTIILSAKSRIVGSSHQAGRLTLVPSIMRGHTLSMLRKHL
jgi:hypothetical protein